MAEPPKPTAKVNMDPNFEQRLKDMQDYAKDESEKRIQGDQVKWFRPKDWDGDLFDYVKMGEPFKRDQANDEAEQAISKPESPGVSGDIVSAQTQIERLSSMERSFRMRHTFSRARCMALMAARKKNHADDKGALIQNGVEYIREVHKQARAEQP